jgi:cation diffusion facilitator CzcD-associated flavoprotein CzcO
MSQPYPVDLEKFDVILIGAGLAGIAGAYHLQKMCPGKRYAILEMRGAMGGTWDIFNYPGIRSDSPMIDYGYGFKPFKAYQHLADGADIRDYIRETAEENDISRKIKYKHKVVAQSWSSETNTWTLDVLVGDDQIPGQIECNFLIASVGYYKYDQGLDGRFPGRDEFIASGRQVLHPQFWPEKVDLAGKRVVVVGSGATAITLVPELSRLCDSLVMVQRSPTYVTTMPRSYTLPLSLFYGIFHFFFGVQAMIAFNRWAQIRFEWLVHTLFVSCPTFAKWLMWRLASWSLGGKAAELRPHFTPTYNPWSQRLCVDADGDFFKTLRTGKATIVTSALVGYTPTGVRLADGREIECDVVVTATGLDLTTDPGNIKLIVDGEPIRLSDKVTYRGMMISDVPNYVYIMGYIYTSWTLRAEHSFQWTYKLINRMQQTGHSAAVPRLRPQDLKSKRRMLIEGFTPNYMLRVLASATRQLEEDPWQLHNQDHFRDLKSLNAPIDDGTLHFS